MTELSEEEQEELSKALDEMECKIRETRPKCTKSWQIELLDELERDLDEMKK